MKFLSQAFIGALSLLTAEAVQQQSDIYYHEKPVIGASMWHFNEDGVSIFAPNGDLVKAHEKKIICHQTYLDYYKVESSDCSYFTYASDGHKYVWAGSTAGNHHIQAFDIDTGDYAGYMDTCSTPLDMTYHPARREMYVRCAEKDDDTPGEMDVFSSETLGSNLPTISFNVTGRAYGRLAIHSDMGPYGYSLQYNKNIITEMDLSSREVSATYEIPVAYAGYDTTFSPVNRHIFFRTRVCCTCNTTETDIAKCPRYSGVEQILVTTGPSKSDVLQGGTCGNSCEGSRADTIGVYEFDTVNKVFVDNHNIKEGTGWGCDPVSSPDGKWIVLLPNDGGQYVRVLEAGKNGESSNFVADVAVDFEGGAKGKSAVQDVAFVQDGNREILIVGSKDDNNIVLVDLKTFTTRKLNLAPGVAESTGGGTRYMEWAVGTEYVWVNGGEAKEAYVIKITGGIDTAVLHRTLTNVASGNLLFVNNYERMRGVAAAQGIANTLNTVQVSPNPKVTSSSNADVASDESSSKSDVLSVVAVVLGSLGLVAGFGALALVMSQKNTATALAAPKKPDVEMAGDKSLGSKLVN
jgi:hypothetical protein